VVGLCESQIDHGRRDYLGGLDKGLLPVSGRVNTIFNEVPKSCVIIHRHSVVYIRCIYDFFIGWDDLSSPVQVLPVFAACTARRSEYALSKESIGV
jgi:hypothetical protein